MKVIPAGPSLVVLVGPSGAGKTHFAERNFEAREVVASDDIRLAETGDIRRQDKNEMVFEEFHRRIETKIRFGNRAVADSTNIRNKDRREVAEIGKSLGVPVVYVVINRSMKQKFQTGGWRNEVFRKGRPLMEAMEETFTANEQTILLGDHGLADLVVDTRTEDFRVAKLLPRSRNGDAVLAHLLDEGFEYVRIIGDVHGNLEGFKKATEGVDDRAVTFFIFLGDVVDYGSQTLQVAERVWKLVSRGEAISIRGNHERKIWNWVTAERKLHGSFQGRITHGNEVTVNQLLAMEPEKRALWEARFVSLVEMSPDWIQIQDMLLTHGAVHERMWHNTLFRAPRAGALEALALFGETTGERDPLTGYPVRKYDWVHELPPGSEAIVGHAIISVDGPIGFRGHKGGSAIFLDTGSSKEKDGREGKLSWLDFKIVESRRRKPRLEFMGGGDQHGAVMEGPVQFMPVPATGDPQEPE